MSDWKKMIPRCFGSNDKCFARHPDDLENARKLILAAYQDKVPETVVKQELINYLKSEGCSPAHIEKEMEWFTDGWAWLT